MSFGKGQKKKKLFCNDSFFEKFCLQIISFKAFISMIFVTVDKKNLARRSL